MILFEINPERASVAPLEGDAPQAVDMDRIAPRPRATQRSFIFVNRRLTRCVAAAPCRVHCWCEIRKGPRARFCALGFPLAHAVRARRKSALLKTVQARKPTDCRRALSSTAPPIYSGLSVNRAEAASVARERRLGAREVEEIFAAFAEAMRELPPDVEAGWLDAQGDLRLAPDIARKLRTARRVRQLLQELRQREREG